MLRLWWLLQLLSQASDLDLCRYVAFFADNSGACQEDALRSAKRLIALE